MSGVPVAWGLATDTYGCAVLCPSLPGLRGPFEGARGEVGEVARTGEGKGRPAVVRGLGHILIHGSGSGRHPCWGWLPAAL